MLDRGFAEYSIFSAEGGRLENIDVIGSSAHKITGEYAQFFALCTKGGASHVQKKLEITDGLYAPISSGDVIGHVVYLLDGKEIGRVEVISTADAPKIDYFTLLWRGVSRFFLK